MRIDYAATQENLKLFNKAQLARNLQVTPPLISLIASGKYPYDLESPKAKRVLDAFRKLNVLVEIPE